MAKRRHSLVGNVGFREVDFGEMGELLKVFQPAIGYVARLKLKDVPKRFYLLQLLVIDRRIRRLEESRNIDILGVVS